MTLKLITFDLDDTLWPIEPVLTHAEGEFYTYLRSQEPETFARISADDLRQHRVQVLSQQPELKHNVSLWRRESLRQLLAEQSLPEDRIDNLVAQAFSVFLNARQQVRLFDGAQECIEELASRYQLIALTNGNANIKQMPIGRYFSEAIRAEDIGRSKPEPDMFERALEIAECQAHESLHIGDDPYYDIAPAQALGMQSLRAAITDKHPPDESSFSHWRELPALIDGLDEHAR